MQALWFCTQCGHRYDAPRAKCRMCGHAPLLDLDNLSPEQIARAFRARPWYTNPAFVISALALLLSLLALRPVILQQAPVSPLDTPCRAYGDAVQALDISRTPCARRASSPGWVEVLVTYDSTGAIEDYEISDSAQGVKSVLQCFEQPPTLEELQATRVSHASSLFHLLPLPRDLPCSGDTVHQAYRLTW